MATLARNFDFLGSRFLTGLTAVPVSQVALPLRFRKYNPAPTATITITAVAGAVSLGSIQFKFIETFTKPSLFPIFRFVVETLWSRQYQTSGFEKLIRIDRLVKEWCE